MEVLDVLDKICQNKPNIKYKNKDEQLIEALYYYIMYEDNSLFFFPNERKIILNFSKDEIKGELIKNIITTYHLKKDLGLNNIFYVDKMPNDFNDEELEYTFNRLFSLGGIKAIDIYFNTFDGIAKKCITHFINTRYKAKRINKDKISRYLDEHEYLQVDFRKIDDYYKKVKEASV